MREEFKGFIETRGESGEISAKLFAETCGLKLGEVINYFEALSRRGIVIDATSKSDEKDFVILLKGTSLDRL